MSEASLQHSSDDRWAWRSELWARRSSEVVKPAKGRRRKQPLILCGHGVSLKIDADSLLIRNGFTHYPQQREELRFFRGSLDIPPQIIMLDGSGHLSFDVLNWLSEQGVTLTRITWDGNAASVAASYGYAANSHRVQWQRETRANNDLRMAFCIDLIARKIGACILTLEKAVPRSDAWERAMRRAYSDLSTLELSPPSTVEELRTLEANSAAAYFRAWRGAPIKWRGLTRAPVPENWNAFPARTSGLAIAGNRNATHPVNAMLNYAYAVLESRIRIRVLADGYDPTIGIMHEGGGSASAFVFDAMEPERAKVDHAILTVLKTNTFHASDFVLRADGVVRLNPQLARKVSIGATEVVARSNTPRSSRAMTMSQRSSPN